MDLFLDIQAFTFGQQFSVELMTWLNGHVAVMSLSKTQESTWRPNMANENLSEFMQERPWESHPQTMHVTVSPCVNLESLGAHEVKIAKEDSSDMLIKIRRQSSWISQFHTTQQYPQIAGNLFQKKQTSVEIDGSQMHFLLEKEDLTYRFVPGATAI